jgi:hypothetical protein
MDDVNDRLATLSMSRFRARFRLDDELRAFVRRKGIAKVLADGAAFIRERVAAAAPANDGRQTPMRGGHPCFVAMHACACCCRRCIRKWHRIPEGRPLTDEEQGYLLALLAEWLRRQVPDAPSGPDQLGFGLGE